MSEFHLAQHPAVAAAIEAASHCKTIAELRDAISTFQGHERAQACPAPPRLALPSSPSGLMIVTEKPELEDYPEGRAFCGAYGAIVRQVLDELGIDQDDHHIAYAVYWPPDDERTPNATLISTCRPFLFKEIAIAKPRAILMLGRVVAESLLMFREPITPWLGNSFLWRQGHQTAQAFLAWHPAYPLRFPMTLGDYRAQIAEFFRRYDTRSLIAA